MGFRFYCHWTIVTLEEFKYFFGVHRLVIKIIPKTRKGNPRPTATDSRVNLDGERGLRIPTHKKNDFEIHTD